MSELGSGASTDFCPGEASLHDRGCLARCRHAKEPRRGQSCLTGGSLRHPAQPDGRVPSGHQRGVRCHCGRRMARSLAYGCRTRCGATTSRCEPHADGHEHSTESYSTEAEDTANAGRSLPSQRQWRTLPLVVAAD